MLPKRFAGGALLILVATCAAAQDRTKGSSANSAQAKKQFAFEVVSIRLHKPGTELVGTEYLPNGYKGSFTLESAIMRAYLPGQLSTKTLNAPDWVGTDWYDLDARVADEDMAAWQQAKGGPDSIDSELLHSAWQALLKERFKLAFHITPVEVPYLNLMVGKSGAKLHGTVPGAIKPVRGKSSSLGKGFYIDDNGNRQFVGVSMDELARGLMRLSRELPVQDKTGLTGRYDFTLPLYPASEMSNPMDRMPLTSIGLGLKPGKGPGFIVDIDHVERPDPN
jgi:uncharacterized protein (TIGR03435 family)